MSKLKCRSMRRSYGIEEELFLLVCQIPTPTPIAVAATTRSTTTIRINLTRDLGASRPVGCSVDFSILLLTSGSEFL